MDKKEIILEHVKNNPVPKPELCPNIIIAYSSSKKGVSYGKYYFPMEGKLFTNNHPYSDIKGYFDGPIREKYVRPFRTGCNSYMLYADYDRANGMIEIATICIKADKPDKTLNSDKREWKYVGSAWKTYDRYFLFKGDSTPYNIDGEPCLVKDQGKFYNREFVKIIRDVSKLDQTNFTMQEFRDFFDVEGLPYYGCAEDRYWGRENLYKNMQPRKKTARDDRIEELLAYKLKDINDYAPDCPIIGTKYKTRGYESSGTFSTYCVFEKIDENTGVFRILSRERRRSFSYADISKLKVGEKLVRNDVFDYEPFRIYVDNNKFIRLNWNPGKSTFEKDLSSLGSYSAVFKNLDDIYSIKFFNDNKEYIEKVLANTPENDAEEIVGKKIGIHTSLVYALNNNVIKAMINNDLTGTLKKIGIGSYTTSMVRDLYAVGTKPTTKEDLEAIFGLNKYQLTMIDKLIDESKWNVHSSRCLKEIFWDQTAKLTNDESSKYIPSILELQRVGNWTRALCPHSVCSYSWYMDNYTPEEREFAQKIFKLYVSEGQQVIDCMAVIANKYYSTKDKDKVMEAYLGVETLDDLIKAQTIISKI